MVRGGRSHRGSRDAARRDVAKRARECANGRNRALRPAGPRAGARGRGRAPAAEGGAQQLLAAAATARRRRPRRAARRRRSVGLAPRHERRAVTRRARRGRVRRAASAASAARSCAWVVTCVPPVASEQLERGDAPARATRPPARACRRRERPLTGRRRGRATGVLEVDVTGRGGAQRAPAASARRTACRCRPARTATSARPRRTRSAPSAATSIATAPAPCAPSSSSGAFELGERGRREARRCASSRASRRRAASAGRPRRRCCANGATRTVTPRARCAASGPSTPGCSSSLVRISSPGREVRREQRPRDPVGRRRRQRDVGGRAAEPAPRSRPAAARARSAAARKYGMPPRPSAALAVQLGARGSDRGASRAGPFVPAFR